MDYKELVNLCEEVCDNMERAYDRKMDECKLMGDYLRVVKAFQEQFARVGDLRDQLEQRDSEIDDLHEQIEQRDRCIAELERQVLEQKAKSLEEEVKAKPMEIHNHFERGSSSQVFNDKVTGKFAKQKKDKNKKEQKKWKKMVKRML
jgi:TolA-binding protein